MSEGLISVHKAQSQVQNLEPIEHNGVRVVTLSLIDELHGRASGTAGRNFRRHRDRMIDGEDYWEILPDEIRLPSSHGGPREKLIVLSESGYCMLVKSFQDDLAWQVQRALVAHYFRPSAPKNVLEQCLAKLTDISVHSVKRIDDLENTVANGFLEVNAKIGELTDSVHAIQKRREPSAETKRQISETVTHFYSGRCPCCESVLIYSSSGDRVVGQHNWEHWEGPTKNRPHQMWATCRECNIKLRESHDYKVRSRPRFDSFQQRREQKASPLLLDVDSLPFSPQVTR